jgi:radical SAM superfamily enzyme YgiQ (UPF0313 family)
VNWDYQQNATINIIDRIPSHIKVIVGGRYATACVEELFAAAPNIDIIVRGDGEDIIRDIALGLPLKDISGISYRENHRIIHNKIRDLVNYAAALRMEHKENQKKVLVPEKRDPYEMILGC